MLQQLLLLLLLLEIRPSQENIEQGYDKSQKRTLTFTGDEADEQYATRMPGKRADAMPTKCQTTSGKRNGWAGTAGQPTKKGRKAKMHVLHAKTYKWT